MEVTFNNVTITIEADSAKAAYLKLCTVLETKDNSIEYMTDTYTVERGETIKDHETDELWPDVE